MARTDADTQAAQRLVALAGPMGPLADAAFDPVLVARAVHGALPALLRPEARVGGPDGRPLGDRLVERILPDLVTPAWRARAPRAVEAAARKRGLPRARGQALKRARATLAEPAPLLARALISALLPDLAAELYGDLPAPGSAAARAAAERVDAWCDTDAPPALTDEEAIAVALAEYPDFDAAGRRYADGGEALVATGAWARLLAETEALAGPDARALWGLLHLDPTGAANGLFRVWQRRAQAELAALDAAEPEP